MFFCETRNLCARACSLILIGITALSPFRAAAQSSGDDWGGSGVRLEGRYWVADSEPRARIRSPLLNQEIDFKRDLGIDESGAPDLRFSFQSRGRNRLMLGYSHLDYSGDRFVERTVEFNNRLYDVGARIVSGLDLKHLRVGWNLQLLNLGDGRWKLGPFVQAHVVWLDASLDAPDLTPPVRATDERVIGFPTFGLATRLALNRRVALFAEASGISAGDYGYFYDGEAGFSFSPARRISLTAAYRLFRFNPRFEPDYARLRISGPQVGAALTF